MTSFLNLYSCWILFIGYQVPKSTLKTTTPIAEGELLRNLFRKLQQDLLFGDKMLTIQQTQSGNFG